MHTGKLIFQFNDSNRAIKIHDPRLPFDWPGYQVQRHYAGRDLMIEVANPNGSAMGIASANLNGASLPVENGSTLIPRGRLLEMPAGTILIKVTLN